MGAKPSSINVVNTISESIINAISKSTQEAGGGYQSVNAALFSHCTIGDGFRMDQSNILKVNADITQEATSNTDFQNSLDETIKQVATSEAQGLSLDAPQSKNFLKKVTNLQTNILQTIVASCKLDGLQVNTIQCQNTTFGNDTYINQENLGDFYLSCAQNSTNVAEAKNDLTTFIDQESSAKSTSMIAYIVMGVVALLVLGTIIYFISSKKKMTDR